MTDRLHHDAKQLLKQHGVTVIEVLHVSPDSILFRGFNRLIRTAWLAVEDGRVVRVAAESGYPAEPSPAVRRQLWPDTEPTELSRAQALADLDAQDFTD